MTTNALFPDIDEPRRGSAVISPCGLYRYTLTRRWGSGQTVNFIMLNPSTADASVDDPTIRRCIGFAKSWRLAGLVVTNLFAFRATDPADLWKAADPVGPENDRHIWEQAAEASLVICAWGNHGAKNGHADAVRAMLGTIGVELYALKLTGEGQPIHPLYQPAGARPIPFPKGGQR